MESEFYEFRRMSLKEFQLFLDSNLRFPFGWSDSFSSPSGSVNAPPTQQVVAPPTVQVRCHELNGVLHVTLELITEIPETRLQYSEMRWLCDMLVRWEIDSANIDETGQEKDQLPLPELGSRRSGRPVLLCNYWALAETVLSREPDIDEWKQLYKWEKGEESEHTDPKKSMKNAVRRLFRQLGKER